MTNAFDFRNFAEKTLGTISEELPETKFLDTGSYALNALISADIYGGIPDNRVTAFAGESGTGKSYLIHSIMELMLKNDEASGAYVHETEFALDKEKVKARGIDANRIILRYPKSIEAYKHEMSNIVAKLAAIKPKNRPRIMFTLDSLGMLPSEKEWGDALEGKNVADMTRQKQIRSAFRVLTLELGKVSAPLIIANHTYANIGGYGDPTTIAGGGGLIYAASTIIALSKRKDVKDGVQTGLLLTAKTFKSRYSRVGQAVVISLDFDTGLDRYYGLTEIALEAGIFTKSGNKIVLPDGTPRFESWIDNNAEKVFDKPTLDRINEFVKERYGFGAEGKEAVEAVLSEFPDVTDGLEDEDE